MPREKETKPITKRSEDQSKWYTEVIQRAGLADYSPVRGCMIIKPYGYAIWERIQQILDQKIKAMGVQNAYFPLFIPYSFLAKEADHVEGFAPEVVLVTYAGGEELEEKLVVRPTSETIIYDAFSRWVESYRDLPLKVNQWANVVRWEKRTTPFLRTTEFLWQVGHTLHATKDEAEQQVLAALDMYYQFVTETLSMHVIKGYKTEAEKFAGAEFTTTIEGMMKDKKALQSGTSHLLSADFTRSFGVKFVDQDGKEQTARATSWGLSTRIIGGIILQHGDDRGLVLPPQIAPVQVRIVPIWNKDNQDLITTEAEKVLSQLRAAGIGADIELSDKSNGYKFAQCEMEGVPIRLELGQRDLDQSVVTLVKRVGEGELKLQVGLTELSAKIHELLLEISEYIAASAKRYTEDNSCQVETIAQFQQAVSEQVGFIYAGFSNNKTLEKQIKEEYGYGTRCIPFATAEEKATCIFSNEPGRTTIFAKAY